MPRRPAAADRADDRCAQILDRFGVVDQPTGTISRVAGVDRRVGYRVIGIGAGTVDCVQLGDDEFQRGVSGIVRVGAGAVQFLQRQDVDRLGIAGQMLLADRLQDGGQARSTVDSAHLPHGAAGIGIDNSRWRCGDLARLQGSPPMPPRLLWPRHKQEAALW